MEVEIFNYSIKVWELFAVVGVLLIILEVVVSGFFILPVGLAFILTALTSIFLSSWLWVWLALALYLGFFVWLFQFKLKSQMSAPVLKSNAHAMVGQEVVVTKTVDQERQGEVKLYGDRWNAYSVSGQTYEEGERVKILEIDGNKVVLD